MHMPRASVMFRIGTTLSPLPSVLFLLPWWPEHDKKSHLYGCLERVAETVDNACIFILEQLNVTRVKLFLR